MEIHQASIHDLNGLRQLEKACFPQDAWPLLDLIAVLTWPEVIRLKAVEQRQMIGFIAADPHPAQGYSWISTLAVVPHLRRRGVGRSLLRVCESRITQSEVRLCVRVDNEAAIGLYVSCGYQKTNCWKAYYANGGDALVMQKLLRQTA